MNLDIPAMVEAISGYAPVVVAVIALAALAEAALGLGVIIPGETFVVLGAVVLSDAGLGWVLIGCLAVAVAASVGDHIGWWIGRSAGPSLRTSRIVRPVGVDKWDRAMDAVQRQGLLPLVLSRQLPGVRTLVSAACGAARVPYRRFATASVVGASIWALLWTGGGALFGRIILDVLGPVLPVIVAVWIVGVVAVLVVKKVRGRVRRPARNH
ncbi:DedA family protein [Corynebacterium halotolerans]|uniref:VTT domain-containing protein n=1 Tax=Corynebacterium halotolerans YIM 70093 = DSM 44683 TaxID=1121362 RepID=M1NL79_9CORY|nr:DedA family protein [Corynebacterium halotolerans]AGF72158.1 hypothetical protein A605_05760 [Corynebacterium halotolerans YIM 70093 = DSM 44683]